jgi:hypothetical protein
MKITGAVGFLAFSKAIGIASTSATVSEGMCKESKRLDEAFENGKKSKRKWAYLSPRILTYRP